MASGLSTALQKHGPTLVINALRQSVDGWRALQSSAWGVTPGNRCHASARRPRHHRPRRLGGSAAFLEILRRWRQRRQEKRQEQLQFDVRILEKGHALRQEAYQREREALRALAEERERRHKAELAALEAQMQAKLEALTRANEDLTRRLGDSLRHNRALTP